MPVEGVPGYTDGAGDKERDGQVLYCLPPVPSPPTDRDDLSQPKIHITAFCIHATGVCTHLGHGMLLAFGTPTTPHVPEPVGAGGSCKNN